MTVPVSPPLGFESKTGDLSRPGTAAGTAVGSALF